MRYYVGIDVAKLSHSVAVVDETGALQGKPFTIKNSAAGFADLVQRLAGVGPKANLRIGLEATGPYGWPLEFYLRSQGFEVLLLNPLQTAAFAKGGIRRTKTDPIDARNIAELLRCGKASASIIPDERSLRLRELTRYRVDVIVLLGRFRNLLGSRIARMLPELATCLGELWSPTALGILEKYPDPRAVAALPPAEFAQEVRSLSRGRLSPLRAQRLQEAARTTIGIPLARDVYSLQVLGIVRILRLLERHLHVVTLRVSKILHEEPEVLTSIPGVGDISAAAILGEIGDIKHFLAPEKLVAFAGVDPTVYQSGQYLGAHAAISKRGSPHLRLAVWNAAFAAIRFNPDLKAYYEKKRAQGKHHKAALACVCRKLLHLVWRLLKDNRPFEDRTDAKEPQGA